ALVHELPHTMAALRQGAISEWRATIVCRETAWLPTESRTRVDGLLAPYLLTLGDKALAAKARALAQSLDPAEAVRHLARAERERRVSTRPAPDSMVYLTALLPMAQGVAAWASLDRAARTAIGTGEAGERTRNQVMADTLVERLTGQATADAVPVEVHLVMTDQTLLGGSEESTSAWLVGHGPIPAGAARDLLDPRHDNPDAAAALRVWLRRLYESPENGQLVAMESTRREFSGNLRRMLVLRDDTCRTPWCDAPIRHADHAHPHADGGTTSYANGSGLCARCNLDKEALGWRHRATADHLTVTTPTGHAYTASSPPLVRGRVRGPTTARARPGRRRRPPSRGNGRGAPRRRRRPPVRTLRRELRAG
ncbi:MAG: HNH endonuclease, partial [Actinomycetes bacterium]|nr:HNH endonuclease [Actinomycetes bacterium]